MNMFFCALGNGINTLIWNIAHMSSRDSKLTTLLCLSVGKHQFVLKIIFSNYKNCIYRTCGPVWDTLGIVAI